MQQDVYLFSGTVAQNIAYGKPGATREEIMEAARLAGAEKFILALKDGFDTYVGERGVKLSGGQKQRIAIARVFLKNRPSSFWTRPPAHWTTKARSWWARALKSWPMAAPP